MNIINLNNKPDPRIDYIFVSIKCLAKLCASLTDNAYCLPGFYDKMKVFREELNRVLARFDSNQSKKFSLEGCTLFEESDTRIGYPEIVSAMTGVAVLSRTE